MATGFTKIWKEVLSSFYFGSVYYRFQRETPDIGRASLDPGFVFLFRLTKVYKFSSDIIYPTVRSCCSVIVKNVNLDLRDILHTAQLLTKNLLCSVSNVSKTRLTEL